MKTHKIKKTVLIKMLQKATQMTYALQFKTQNQNHAHHRSSHISEAGKIKCCTHQDRQQFVKFSGQIWQNVCSSQPESCGHVMPAVPKLFFLYNSPFSSRVRMLLLYFPTEKMHSM